VNGRPNPSRDGGEPELQAGGVAAVVARSMPLILVACTALLLAQWWVLARGPWGPPGAPPPPYYPPPYPAGPPVVYYQPMPPPVVVAPAACACADCGCAPCYGCDCGGPGGCVCDWNYCGCGGCGVNCAAVPPATLGDGTGTEPAGMVRPGPAALLQSVLGGIGLLLPIGLLWLWRRRR